MSSLDMTAPYPGPSLPRSPVKMSEFSMRGRVITGSVAAILLVAGMGGWAATAKLSGAIISNGTVLVAENVKVIQHLDGGVIRDINVRKGQDVAVGEVLLRLDDVQIRTEQSILAGQIAELRARQARLIAERDASSEIKFPENFLTIYPDGVPILQGEQQLFESTARNRRSQRQ